MFGISQVGTIYPTGSKIAEHSGDNPGDRDVPLVVYAPGRPLQASPVRQQGGNDPGRSHDLVSFQSSVDDPMERRVSTVGRIHPHLEVKIVDATGRVAPRGTPGELLTRGYSVMRGYWDDPEQTAQAIDAAGWMHTGDLATIDEEGYCNIVGRLKDMVIRGGENIYPREVEEFLFRHPKIEAAQVFGIPDAKFGEELCAWIKVRAGETLAEADIRAFCEGQIARYKIPRHIRLVADYPMTVTGKVQKFAMRQQMIAELGLAETRTA